MSTPTLSPRLTRSWRTVHTTEAITIAAHPDLLVALYLDYERWPELFPATIRGVRILGRNDSEATVEVDHRTEGRVMNVVRQRAPHEIELRERKPRYSATFVNRFDAAGDGTLYTVIADVRLAMPYALLAPVAGLIVRRAVRRHVLEPMRAAAERVAPVRGEEGAARAARSTDEL